LPDVSPRRAADDARLRRVEVQAELRQGRFERVERRVDCEMCKFDRRRVSCQQLRKVPEKIRID